MVTGNNVNIYSNTSTSLGGGVFLYGATATFTNSNIYNNTAVAGAGVYGMLYNAYPPALNLTSYADVYSNNALTGMVLAAGSTWTRARSRLQIVRISTATMPSWAAVLTWSPAP